ncbi:MAG: S-layer homology domain-containing protein [Ruminococcaceae bacterium]|nr:S-layer homology domain-containing protein [Oscillospiraceae bacterium]
MKVLESNGNPLVDEDTTINFYDPAVISRAAVEVAAPVTGAAPAAEVEFSDRFSAAVNWSPAVEGEFKAGVAYTAEVVLTAEEGYSFAEAPEFNLNGAKASDVKVEGNTAILTFEFDRTLYYSDVALDSAYYNAIGALTEIGVVNGYGDGTFGVADKITEAHFDLMISRSGATGVEMVAGMTRGEAAKAIYEALGLAPVIVPREGNCIVTFSDGRAFETKIGEDFVFFFQCNAPGDMGAPAEGEEGAGITVSEGNVTYSNVGVGGPFKYPTSEKVIISGFTGDITVTITEAATNMGATYSIYTEEADIAAAIAFAEKMAAQMAANPMH